MAREFARQFVKRGCRLKKPCTNEIKLRRIAICPKRLPAQTPCNKTLIPPKLKKQLAPALDAMAVLCDCDLKRLVELVNVVREVAACFSDPGIA
jgi:hypothetical protein